MTFGENDSMHYVTGDGSSIFLDAKQMRANLALSNDKSGKKILEG